MWQVGERFDNSDFIAEARGQDVDIMERGSEEPSIVDVVVSVRLIFLSCESVVWERVGQIFVAGRRGGGVEMFGALVLAFLVMGTTGGSGIVFGFAPNSLGKFSGLTVRVQVFFLHRISMNSVWICLFARKIKVLSRRSCSLESFWSDFGSAKLKDRLLRARGGGAG